MILQLGNYQKTVGLDDRFDLKSADSAGINQKIIMWHPSSLWPFQQKIMSLKIAHWPKMSLSNIFHLTNGTITAKSTTIKSILLFFPSITFPIKVNIY